MVGGFVIRPSRVNRLRWSSPFSLAPQQVLLASLFCALVMGDYPGVLFPWSEDCSSDYEFCGTLEFCRGERDYEYYYGYRLPCMEEDDSNCECPGISGPLIRIQAGKKYQLTLRNAVPSLWTSTNLHTHGLHIVGSGDSDDVTRRLSGGGEKCLDYTWDIPADHPGGTYWYHAHKHGSTEEQVGTGAYGMLIVEDNLSLNPDLPAWTQNELLLQVGIHNDGTLFGNGKELEILNLQADQWYRLRVSMVEANAVPSNLEFLDDDNNCNIHKVASDGIWRSEIPGPKATTFELTGASRADFAIRCRSSRGASAASTNYQVNMTHGVFVERQFATLQIGAPPPDESLYTMPRSWNPIRPAALQDMLSIDTIPEANKLSVSMQYGSVNGDAWDPKVALANIAYDEVHEWTLVGTNGHPFHLHLYHLQIASTGCGPAFEVGEFYDVVSASSSDDGPCIVRFRTADIGQRCVLHCHVLLHEDNGSMAWVNVTDYGSGIMPRNNVESPEYFCAGESSMPSTTPTTTPSKTPSAKPSTSPSRIPSNTPSVSPSVPTDSPEQITLSPTGSRINAVVSAPVFPSSSAEMRVDVFSWAKGLQIMAAPAMIGIWLAAI